jgi:5-methylcytosine-specific restriction endonuclease McrA
VLTAGEGGPVSRALVLNASFEPLCVVPTRRAVVLVLKQKAEVLHATDRELHSERQSFPEPSVIRLTYFVKVPFRTRAALSRRAVFARDRHRCQYCGTAAENIDHVVPKSRGGLHEWENVVAACRPCNARKEDRLPHEVGMALRRKPTVPRELTWIIVAVASHAAIPESWRNYLQPLPAAEGLAV